MLFDVTDFVCKACDASQAWKAYRAVQQAPRRCLSLHCIASEPLDAVLHSGLSSLLSFQQTHAGSYVTHETKHFIYFYLGAHLRGCLPDAFTLALHARCDDTDAAPQDPPILAM